MTGILRCEKCGKVLSYQKGFFGCSERSRGKCDGVGYIKAEKIAKIVLNILSEMELPEVEINFAKSDSVEKTILTMKVKLSKLKSKDLKFGYGV